jgi:hypothetical protein
MEGWEFLSVVIGIFGALFGVYFREAIRKAYTVKTIATRLDAYIRVINKSILETENDSKELFYLGKLWQKERSDAYIKSGKDAFFAVDEKFEPESVRLQS